MTTQQFPPPVPPSPPMVNPGQIPPPPVQVPGYSKAGAAGLCLTFALIALIVFALTSHDVAMCNSAGIFAPQQCSGYQTWHELGLGGFITGLLATAIFSAIAITERAHNGNA